MRDEFARYVDRRSGLRVAAAPRRSIVHRETAETADLDPPSVGQFAYQVIEQQLDRKFDILVRHVCLTLNQSFDEFGFGHLPESLMVGNTADSTEATVNASISTLWSCDTIMHKLCRNKKPDQ